MATEKKRKIDKTIEDFHLSYHPATQVAQLALNLKNSSVNILTSAVLLQLDKHLNSLRALPVKVLVIKSGKPGQFIAGADIREITAMQAALQAPPIPSSIETAKNTPQKIPHATNPATQLLYKGQEILSRLANFPAPTIAVLDGHALGGGLELALCCDYRVVTNEKNTLLGLPEVNLGIIPGFGGTLRLPALIGLPQALKMLLSGKAISGAHAYRLGLGDWLIPRAYIAFELPKIITTVLTTPAAIVQARHTRRSKHFPFLYALLVTLGKKYLLNKTHAQLAKKLRQHYPAPFKLIQVVKKTYPAKSPAAIARGLHHESKAFLDLLATTTTRNLLSLFAYTTQLKKHPFPKPPPYTSRPRRPSPATAKSKYRSTPQQPIQQSWVIGAGVMGSGIAWFLSHAGLPVRVKEVAWDYAKRGYKNLRAIHTQREKFARQSPHLTKKELARVAYTTTWGPSTGKTLIVEAGPESIPTKQQILRDIEAHSSPQAIIATNTSSLPLEKLSQALKHKERFLAMHFFNPVHRLPLVELAPCPHTDPKLFAEMGTFLAKQKRMVIPVKACPGFLVNRILVAYLNEAMQLLEEIKDIELIDTCMQKFGMPMGPFRLIDEIGIDIATHVTTCLQAHYPHLPNHLANYRNLTKQNWLGRKNNNGFYVYRNRQPIGVNPNLYATLYQYNLNMKRTFKAEDITHRLVMALAHEALLTLAEGVVASHWELDLALIYGIGFPAFRGGVIRYLDTLGLQKSAKLFDYLKNFHGDHFAVPPNLTRQLATRRNFYSS